MPINVPDNTMRMVNSWRNERLPKADTCCYPRGIHFVRTTGRGCGHWPKKAVFRQEGFYDLLRRVTPGPRLDVFGGGGLLDSIQLGQRSAGGIGLPDHYQTVMM